MAKKKVTKRRSFKNEPFQLAINTSRSGKARFVYLAQSSNLISPYRWATPEETKEYKSLTKK